MADDSLPRAHPSRPAIPGVFRLDELARQVVLETDPAQLPLLAEVTDSWERGRLPVQQRADLVSGSVGSAITSMVTSDLIYPLLTGTLAQVLGIATVTRWRRWRLRRAQVPAPSTTVSLTAAQIEAFRVECVATGVRLGLTRAKATVLADAAYGALCRAMTQPDSARQAPSAR